jgi:hypothetical protein
MKTLTVHTRVGDDGILKIETPIGITNAELEVILVVNPKDMGMRPFSIWPENFFTEILGGWEGKKIGAGTTGNV